MMRADAAAGEAPRLPEAIVAFLVRFSIALHKHSTYPPGHPTLRAADDSVAESLAALFASRAELRLGVARHELVVDESATDQGHPVLRELAERLHRRSVGGLLLRKGLTAEELAEVLQALSGDPTAMRRRLLGEGDPLPTWPHATVVPLAFRRLALAGDEGSGEDATEVGHRLWLELAAATLEGGGGEDDHSPAVLARELNARARSRKGAAEAGKILIRLGRFARATQGRERDWLDERVRELVRGLDPQALGWLFDGENPAERRQFLTEAVEVLPVESVVALLEAAATSTGQQISHFLLRLLRKLARQAGGVGDEGERHDAALRDAARELVDEWTLEDPNPDVHAGLLDALSRHEAADAAGGAPLQSEGRRLLQIALETDSTGDHLLEAAELMIESRELGALLDLLDQAPEATRVVAAVRAHLRSPTVLRQVLLEEPVDIPAAQRLLGTVGPEAAPGLLDALAISEAQPTRRLILERLAGMGEAVGPLFAQRLPEAPWYVQRNLLALLGRLPALPPGFSAFPYAEHPEVTVRYQALNVMLRQPAERDEAIYHALGDSDPRVVRFGLDAAARGFPRNAITRLMLLLNNPQRPLDLRVRGILLLAQVRTPTVRDWLLERVLTKRTLLRSPRLAPKTPEVVACLVVLARRWKELPQADLALRQAAESGDPDLMAAARGQEPA